MVAPNLYARVWMNEIRFANVIVVCTIPAHLHVVFFHDVLYKQALTKMILLIYTTSNSINIMPTLRKTTIENPDLILYYNFMSLTIK